MGSHLGEFTFENVRFTDLKGTSVIWENKDELLTIKLKNVKFEFVDGAKKTNPFVIDKNSNTKVIIR